MARTEVDAALARLHEHGYLDDAAFARGLVARRSAVRGRSAMAAELRGRGIGRQLADAALGDLDSEAEVDAAERLARRFGGGLPRDLVAARLHRRGFGADSIRRALRRLEAPDQG
ncbi:MAG TPA: regulatory protein RecX [Candidatus Acidoferrales bacterium]|nr:regulatory protein RecX [Candidatus Acidoferrales bacterium]